MQDHKRPGRFSKEARLQRAREKFAPDDPLRYQHVLRGDRLKEDETEIDPERVDLSAVRRNPGEIVNVDVPLGPDDGDWE